MTSREIPKLRCLDDFCKFSAKCASEFLWLIDDRRFLVKCSTEWRDSSRAVSLRIRWNWATRCQCTAVTITTQRPTAHLALQEEVDNRATELSQLMMGTSYDISRTCCDGAAESSVTWPVQPAVWVTTCFWSAVFTVAFNMKAIKCSLVGDSSSERMTCRIDKGLTWGLISVNGWRGNLVPFARGRMRIFKKIACYRVSHVICQFNKICHGDQIHQDSAAYGTWHSGEKHINLRR